MPRPSKPPRLYLRRRGQRAIWVIRDGPLMLTTTFGEDDLEAAKAALEAYCDGGGYEPGGFSIPGVITGVMGTVYFVTCDLPNYPVKIGWASDMPSRLSSLQSAHPYSLRVLASQPGTMEDERRLHLGFHASRLEREWFARTPELMTLIGQINNYSPELVRSTPEACEV